MNSHAQVDANTETSSSFWDFLIFVYENDGILILLFIFIAFMFYKLVWRVWSSTIDSKDAEIERLVKERDYYQSIVFPNLLTSKPQNKLTDQEVEDRV